MEDDLETAPVDSWGGDWYSVRCFLRSPPDETSELPNLYEERLTVWRATSFDHAIEQAKVEAIDYAEIVGVEYLGFVQAYKLADDFAEGAEVFSLVRRTAMSPQEYLDCFNDEGDGPHHGISP